MKFVDHLTASTIYYRIGIVVAVNIKKTIAEGGGTLTGLLK